MLPLQVSAQILALISQHATNRQCEKTSYDDFYLEVVPADAQLSASDGWQPPDHSKMHILGDTSWAALPAVLKWAVQVMHVLHAITSCHMIMLVGSIRKHNLLSRVH